MFVGWLPVALVRLASSLLPRARVRVHGISFISFISFDVDHVTHDHVSQAALMRRGRRWRRWWWLWRRRRRPRRGGEFYSNSLDDLTLCCRFGGGGFQPADSLDDSYISVTRQLHVAGAEVAGSSRRKTRRAARPARPAPVRSLLASVALPAPRARTLPFR